jgi:DNA-binding NarL/FixJ family response regulator
MQKTTILIADDHTMIVEAFRKLLEPQYNVIGTVRDGRELLEAAPRLRPDVIVVDIGMPFLNGLAAGQRLKQIMPRVKLIYVTMNQDPDVASEALDSGASAYLLKSSAASELLQGIHEALKGGTYVTPLIKQALAESFIRCPHPKLRANKLTERQLEVLQLLAEGRLMKEVGAVLGLTPRTIAFHKYRIMEALGVKTNAELIQFAVRNHVVAPHND